MAKQHVAEQETLGEAMNKTEFFFEKNGRMLSYVFLGLLVLAALVFGYRALIVSPRAEKAAEMIAEAQYRFEDQNADYALALEGDANGAGFPGNDFIIPSQRFAQQPHTFFCHKIRTCGISCREVTQCGISHQTRFRAIQPCHDCFAAASGRMRFAVIDFC